MEEKKGVEDRHEEALYRFCSSTVPSTVFETSLKLCHSRRPLDGGQGSGESGRAESNSQGDIASPDDFHWFSPPTDQNSWVERETNEDDDPRTSSGGAQRGVTGGR